MPELGENREDAAGSLNSVYRPSWLLLPACNLFFWVYPRVVSMSMPNYSTIADALDKARIPAKLSKSYLRPSICRRDAQGSLKGLEWSLSPQEKSAFW